MIQVRVHSSITGIGSSFAVDYVQIKTKVDAIYQASWSKNSQWAQWSGHERTTSTKRAVLIRIPTRRAREELIRQEADRMNQDSK